MDRHDLLDRYRTGADAFAAALEGLTDAQLDHRPADGGWSARMVAHHVAAVSMWRITLTPIVLDAAAEVLFLVSGREKAAIVREVLEGPHRPDVFPAQVVAPRAGRLRWLLDAAAASELEGR